MRKLIRKLALAGAITAAGIGITAVNPVGADDTTYLPSQLFPNPGGPLICTTQYLSAEAQNLDAVGAYGAENDLWNANFDLYVGDSTDAAAQCSQAIADYAAEVGDPPISSGGGYLISCYVGIGCFTCFDGTCTLAP